MKPLSDFDTGLQQFIQEESRIQADRILEEKDPAKSEFSLETLRKFSYKVSQKKRIIRFCAVFA